MFIFLILSTIFILLQNGIYLDDISISNIKAKKLYIKWDEKITLVAQEVIIEKDEKAKETGFSYKNTIKKLNYSILLAGLFEKITINKLSYDDLNGSFNYTSANDGLLSLSSNYIKLKSSLNIKEDFLNINISEFNHENKKIHVDGNITLRTSEDFKITSTLNIGINDDANLTLYANADDNKLSYKVESVKDIKDTKYIVDLFNMDPRAKYWVYDAMDMSSFSLKSASGWLQYDKPEEAYKNLHVTAVANELVYVYDTKVDSVRTSHTDLEFKGGVLYIRPQNAYSYDFFLDKSWLKIDFSKKEELLTLYLLFKGKVNSNLLSLLNRYGIKLPFIQTKGEMDTNLKLVINLITADVSALGDFYAKESQINYLGLDLDLFDTHVYLKDSDVKVKNMFAKYKEIASAHVDLDFNARKSKGTLDFRIDKVSLKEVGLELNKSKKPLHATYTISPKQDFIDIEKSKWKIKDKNFDIAPLKIPFDMKTLSAEIPLTSIESDSISAHVSGKLLFKPMMADLNIDLFKIDYSGILLNQSTARLSLAYDKEFILSSKNSIKLAIDNKKYTLNNLKMNIDSNIVKASKMQLKIDNSLKSEIAAEYNLKTSKGFADIFSIEYVDDKLGEVFKRNKKSRVYFSNKNSEFSLHSQDYDVEYMLNDKEWKLKFNSLDKIAEYSNILNKYSLTNGSFMLHKVKDKENIDFTLNSDYKYKLLVNGNKPVDNYTAKGKINVNTEFMRFNINDAVDVIVDDDIRINAKNIGINRDEIVNLLDDEMMTKGSKSNSKFSFESTNCYIYFSEDRRAVSDKLDLQYFNNLLTAQLKHKEGSAYFKFLDDDFHLYGENFNDEFMENLFAVSKFKGGKLEFSIDGTTKEYVGSIYAKDTTIRNYRVLNNILAFVNTVPSLVTFSLPGYNTKGLKADSTYINFGFKDDVYTMTDIALKSKEIDILGHGVASIKNNSINLELNLRTDLGSSLSKVPLVGYILLGDESISTSLTVTGKLDDPDVNTQVAKDIMVAPLNIIKRTFMFPFEIFKDKKDR
ncbi:MAG: AsmA-like C-terminal domain-containing protein [Sulfurimonas sp.]|nr:AsmA-like C-terminal domain-containing protein [Sulfurimonas sp.]